MRVRNGRLHRRFAGVYVVGYEVLSLEACFLAAVKACGPDAVLSHYSAAVLHRLLGVGRPRARGDDTTVAQAPGAADASAKKMERCYVKGIPVTPVLRTIIDLSGSRLPAKQAAPRGQRGARPARDRLGELVTSDHRGAQRLREILASAAPTMNEFEDVVLAIVHAGRPADARRRPVASRLQAGLPLAASSG